MIERRFVDQYARGSGVNLDVGEREVTLTYVLAALHEHGLGADIAFKGGTFLRKMVFGNNGRFSEDLDFQYVGSDWEDWYLRLEEACREPFCGVRLTVDEMYETDNSLGLEMSYGHSFVTAGHFSLDLSRRASLILPSETRLPVEQAYFTRLPFTPPAVKCMHLVEAWAEKLRASYERAKPRDLLDLYLLTQRPVDLRLLRRLTVLKVWEDRQPFRPGDLVVHWADVEEDWGSLGRLCRKPIPVAFAACRTRYAALEALDPGERDLAADASRRRTEQAADLRCELLAWLE